MKRKELFRILVVLNLIVVTGSQSVYAQARSDVKGEVIGKIEIIEELGAIEQSEIVEELKVVEEAEMAEESEVVEEAEMVEETEVIEEAEMAEETEVIEETEIAEESEVIEGLEVLEELEVTELEDIEELETVEKLREVTKPETVVAPETIAVSETAPGQVIQQETATQPEVVKEPEAVKELEADEETKAIATPKPAEEVDQPIEIKVAQDLISANQEAVKPQVVIIGDSSNEKIEILVLDKDGNEVGRHKEKMEANGVVYDFAEINEDGIYIMHIQRVSADGEISISKYVFTINQNGTSFCHDMAMENGHLEKAFSPRIKMENVDAITVLSCTINGEEIPYFLESDELVIDSEILKGGKNQIALIVKDAAGNISEMKPWEFNIKKAAKKQMDEEVKKEIGRGNFWFRMIKKILA